MSKGPCRRVTSARSASAALTYRAPRRSMSALLRYGSGRRPTVVTSRPRRRSASVASRPMVPAPRTSARRGSQRSRRRLDLVRLAQRFRDARERLGEDRDRLQVVRDEDEGAGVRDHLLGHEAVGPADAGLDEGVVGREVRATDAVVLAAAGSTDGDHDELAGLDPPGRTRTDLQDAGQRFVAQHQEVGALRRATVLAADEVRVRAAQPGADDADPHASTARDVIDRRAWDVPQVQGAGARPVGWRWPSSASRCRVGARHHRAGLEAGRLSGFPWSTMMTQRSSRSAGDGQARVCPGRPPTRAGVDGRL